MGFSGNKAELLSWHLWLITLCQHLWRTRYRVGRCLVTCSSSCAIKQSDWNNPVRAKVCRVSECISLERNWILQNNLLGNILPLRLDTKSQSNFPPRALYPKGWCTIMNIGCDPICNLIRRRVLYIVGWEVTIKLNTVDIKVIQNDILLSGRLNFV